MYQIITNLTLEKLNQGIIPWRQPWSQTPAQNYYSGTIYRGINALLLNCLGLREPYFLTFSQVQKLGGSIKKGAHSYLVTYWRISYYEPESRRWFTQEEAQQHRQDDLKVRPLLRYYRVFAIEDIAGIDFKLPQTEKRLFTTKEKMDKGFAPLYTMPHPLRWRTVRLIFRDGSKDCRMTGSW